MRHLGRTLGERVDCVGLVIMVGLAKGVLELPDFLASPWAKYGLLPNSASMRKAMETYMLPVDGPHRDADVGFFRMDLRSEPMHLAIMATFQGRQTMIQANAAMRSPRVVEASYAGGWPERLDSFWRYPGLA